MADKKVEVDESKELDAIKGDAQDVKNLYKQYSPETLDALHKISSFARDVNISMQPPEIVVVGFRGVGKSLIIESIFGHAFLKLPNNQTTKRPIFINVVQNMDCVEPRITIKRDNSVEEVPFTNPSEVVKELEKRCASQDTSPIQVKYESKYYGSFVIVDTPGKFHNFVTKIGLIRDGNDPNKEAVEKVVMELVKPQHRTIMFVDECNDWEQMDIIEFAKKIDVKFSRSFFVFGKFNAHLQKFSNQREFSQYFGKRPADTKSFFLTLFSGPTRDEILKSKEPKLDFQLRTWQATERDLIALEDLKFDKRNEDMIGSGSLRAYILDLVWRSVKDLMPELRKQLALSKKVSSDNLKKIQDQYSSMDVVKLRSITSNYVADWLQVLVQLIEGSTEGNPTINGQSLEEEDTIFGVWIDGKNRFIPINPSQAQVKNWDVKLYGGQQFERMMSVFRGIGTANDIISITDEDIQLAAAVGYQRNNVYDYEWVASHIVQNKIKSSFGTLIEQMCKRAEFIMKRLADIGFNILESRSSRKTGGMKNEDTPIQSLRGYSYFQSTVRDIFNEYVDRTANVCLQKCMNEIACTQLIYLDIPKKSTPPPSGKGFDKNYLMEVAKKLFQENRDTIVDNVLLKCHNVFLVVMQRDLSGEILKDTTSFDDRMLEEMFELTVVKEKLKREEEKEKQAQHNFQEKETVLRDLGTQFSRLKLVATA